jgi:hypothetical protein
MSSLRSSIIVALLALFGGAGLSLGSIACSNQGEGARCEIENADDDCQEGLVCTSAEQLGGNADICCPPGGVSENPACIPGGGSTTSTTTSSTSTGGGGGAGGEGGAGSEARRPSGGSGGTGSGGNGGTGGTGGTGARAADRGSSDPETAAVTHESWRSARRSCLERTDVTERRVLAPSDDEAHHDGEARLIGGRVERRGDAWYLTDAFVERALPAIDGLAPSALAVLRCTCRPAASPTASS